MSKKNGPMAFLTNLVGHEQQRLKTPGLSDEVCKLLKKTLCDFIQIEV